MNIDKCHKLRLLLAESSKNFDLNISGDPATVKLLLSAAEALPDLLDAVEKLHRQLADSQRKLKMASGQLRGIIEDMTGPHSCRICFNYDDERQCVDECDCICHSKVKHE